MKNRARGKTDFPIKAASRALAAGDPISALNFVALRNDAAALALRGIALAQMGDLVRAKALLGKAARTFGAKSAVARAKCILAEAEIALVSRELIYSAKKLREARTTLERHGDFLNTPHARLLEGRRLLLIGRIDEAERALAGLNSASLPPAWRTGRELMVAGISIARLRIKAARAAIARARKSARAAGIPALMAEVEGAARLLNTPAARLIRLGQERLLRLEEVEALLASETLVVDACRRWVRQGATVVSLARRPVLFALARALAEAGPADVPRGTLITKAFQPRVINESHRVRLRVEIGRLRKKLKPLAGVNATMRGFVLVPRRARKVAVLAWPGDEGHAAVLAFLADGESWSSSALATALGTSQRHVQRALEALAQAGKVQAFGCGRARRWRTPPVPGFTTVLLLPGSLPVN